METKDCPPMPLQPGTTFGAFEIGELLGVEGLARGVGLATKNLGVD